jgi:hypothetical protein
MLLKFKCILLMPIPTQKAISMKVKWKSYNVHEFDNFLYEPGDTDIV